METTERIVEAYVRYVKGWATIPNVRCDGQHEIDLIAADLCSDERYHIEVSISISQSFRKLTGKPFDPKKAKERVHAASQRRTVGFFRDRKFNAEPVVECLKRKGFEPEAYHKVIVTWGWDDDAWEQAEASGIVLWDFRQIIRALADTIRGSRSYFSDDTLRTLNLFIHASDDRNTPPPDPQSSNREVAPDSSDGQYWVYENWVHDYAKLHQRSCSYCNDGRGFQSSSGNANGQWIGPFDTEEQAWSRAYTTKRTRVKPCRTCLRDTEAP